MTRIINETVNPDLKISGVAKPTDWPEGADHVVILLASYNGAQTIDEQLASLCHQSHGNWSLIASDDGSCDETLACLYEFSERAKPHHVKLVKGPQQDFAQNFLSLLRQAGPSAPFAALCDQDDVWLPGKLTKALQHLLTVPAGRPALYVGRTMICDGDLAPLRASPLFKRKPSFENALVQSIGGGNTMVLNRKALDIIQESSTKAKGIAAHDWWIYQIVTGAGGTVIYDQEPQVMYRQHSDNIIGASDTIRASAFRLLQLFSGRFKCWNNANVNALKAAQYWLTPSARRTLAQFDNARHKPVFSRIMALRRAGLYRQSRRGNIALWLATFIRLI